MAARKAGMLPPTGLRQAAGSVRLFVFDFDQTLSVVHVFKSLAGWAEKAAPGTMKLPRPFASTEFGQLRRIEELSQTAPFRSEGFACTLFGGAKRVEQVRQFLRSLKELDCELLICTKGLVGAVKKVLLELDLLDMFTEVYGNIGSEVYGVEPYDKSIMRTAPTEQERRLLGKPEASSWGQKSDLIQRLMVQRRLRKDQVVLIEDDPEEIRRAAPISRTHWVREAAGITAADMDALRRLAMPPSAIGAADFPPRPNGVDVGLGLPRAEMLGRQPGLGNKRRPPLGQMMPLARAPSPSADARANPDFKMPPRNRGASVDRCVEPVVPSAPAPVVGLRPRRQRSRAGFAPGERDLLY